MILSTLAMDLVGFGIQASLIFAGVFLAYYLGVRQERSRERSERDRERKTLLNLFKLDMNNIVDSLRSGVGPRERVYAESWDAAKYSGRLSVLTVEEMSILSEAYVKLRMVNDAVEDAWKIRTYPMDTHGDLELANKMVVELRREALTQLVEAGKKLYLK